MELLTESLLTEEALCQRTGLHRQTLWRARKRRRDPLPYRHVFGRVYYDLDEFNTWVSRQTGRAKRRTP